MQHASEFLSLKRLWGSSHFLCGNTSHFGRYFLFLTWRSIHWISLKTRNMPRSYASHDFLLAFFIKSGLKTTQELRIAIASCISRFFSRGNSQIATYFFSAGQLFSCVMTSSSGQAFITKAKWIKFHSGKFELDNFFTTSVVLLHAFLFLNKSFRIFLTVWPVLQLKSLVFMKWLYASFIDFLMPHFDHIWLSFSALCYSSSLDPRLKSVNDSSQRNRKRFGSEN